MILGDPIIFGGSGGGSGPSASDAILTVTVPTGSTVTMTKGGITLTPTMWVQAKFPALDCALFVIAPAQFDSVNPWTVTATVDGYDTSDTVVINSNKQYDLSLGYTYVYKDGTIYPIAGNLVKSSVEKSGWAAGIFTKGSSSFTLETRSASNNLIAVSTYNTISLGDYSTIYFSVSSISGISASGVIADFAITTSKSFDWGNNSRSSPPYSNGVVTAYSTISDTGIFAIDVSGYNNEQYITVLLGARSAATIVIDAIYME